MDNWGYFPFNPRENQNTLPPRNYFKQGVDSSAYSKLLKSRLYPAIHSYTPYNQQQQQYIANKQPTNQIAPNQNQIIPNSIKPQPYKPTTALTRPHNVSTQPMPQPYTAKPQSKPYNLRSAAKQGPDETSNEVVTHHGLYAGVGKFGFMDEAKSNAFFTNIGKGFMVFNYLVLA